MDEFGNLDFTKTPSQYANEKNYNTKGSNSYSYNTKSRPTYPTRTPTTQRRPKPTKYRRKIPKKDPIRTTMDHFSVLYNNPPPERNRDDQEVVYNFEYPKKQIPKLSNNFRRPVSEEPNRGYDLYGQLKNTQKTAGKKVTSNEAINIYYPALRKII